MNASGSSRPIAMRRHEIERNIAAQRVSIAAAWTDFEEAEGRVELNLRRAIGWTRRASSIAVSVAAFCTLRRMYRAARRRGSGNPQQDGERRSDLAEPPPPCISNEASARLRQMRA
jgi:hypothetical protein